MESKALQYMRFQSPRSGKFVSDTYAIAIIALATVIIGFNPLDRGNLYLIEVYWYFEKRDIEVSIP